MPDKPLSETSDWEEQDLLTIAEAGTRLREEVDTARRQIAEARGHGDDAEAARLEERLVALTRALERIGLDPSGA